VIDSFVYVAIGNWRWILDGESSLSAYGDYERVLLDYLNQRLQWPSLSLTTPGSGQTVETSGSLECLKKVVRYIA
jgi:hypothetical protein